MYINFKTENKLNESLLLTFKDSEYLEEIKSLKKKNSSAIVNLIKFYFNNLALRELNNTCSFSDLFNEPNKIMSVLEKYFIFPICYTSRNRNPKSCVCLNVDYLFNSYINIKDSEIILHQDNIMSLLRESNAIY